MTTYLQGRLFAATPADALDKLYAHLQQQGYEAAGVPRLKAANVQPATSVGLWWIEWRIKIYGAGSKPSFARAMRRRVLMAAARLGMRREKR